MDLAEDASFDELADWVEQHPHNFDGLRRYAQQLIEARRWDEAKKVLQKLIDLCPDYVGADNPYALLAVVSRETKDTDQEKSMLEHLASRTSDDTDVYLRLMELSATEQDWESVARNADRMLAVNPLVPAPHRYRSEAAEKLNDRTGGQRVVSGAAGNGPRRPGRASLPTGHHLHAQAQDDEAQRHVLMALEEAPRYRDAHRLLLAIAREPGRQPLPDRRQWPSRRDRQRRRTGRAGEAGRARRNRRRRRSQGGEDE